MYHVKTFIFRIMNDHFQNNVDYSNSEDFCVNDLIGKRSLSNDLVEFRVQIKTNNCVKIEGGQTETVCTHLLLQKNLKNRSLLFKKNEQISNLYISEGLISHQFRGRLSIEVTNINPSPIELPPKFLIGYLIISPLIKV